MLSQRIIAFSFAPHYDIVEVDGNFRVLKAIYVTNTFIKFFARRYPFIIPVEIDTTLPT